MSRATLRELALAALIGAFVGVSPISSHETVPSVLAAVVAAGATYVYRMRRTGPVEAEEAPRTAAMPWKLAPAALLYLAIALPIVLWMYARWTTGVWVNGHGLFMPLIVAYLSVQVLRDDVDPSPRASVWGLPVIALGLLVIVADAWIGNGYLGALGLLVTLPGLSLALLGRSRTRALAVPLAVTPLMAPIPNSVATHLYLRQVTAWGVEWLLDLLRIPAIREGTKIEAAQNVFVVSDACSGFATTYAAIAVAVVLASLVRSPWRRAALLVAALPLALAANIIRVLFLVLISENVGAWVLDTVVHPGSGIATFFVVLAGLLLIANTGRSREALPA